MSAFTALAEYGAAYGPFPDHQVLVYNQLITNIGGAYCPTTGIFKAPVAGFYFFTFSYHAGGELKSVLKLFRNDEHLITSSDQATNTDFSDNGSNAIVLELNTGDKVYVRMEKNSRVWAAEKHTSFSGFLIRAGS